MEPKTTTDLVSAFAKEGVTITLDTPPDGYIMQGDDLYAALEALYPLTFVLDRYDGTYSGGRWIAWNLEPHMVPMGPQADDVTCRVFWETNQLPAGRGDTPAGAVLDLLRQLREG